MTPDQIRQWCMQAPRPAKVRVTDADDIVNEVICGVTPWTKVGETIAALRPELLQALDDKGNLLRAVRPGELSEDWNLVEENKPRKSQQGPAGVEGVRIEDLDPESKRMALVATLIANAYRHSTDVAFERLAELFDNLNRRQDNVERTREQMYRAHVKQLEEQLHGAGIEPADAPQGGLELLMRMAEGFLGGMNQGSGETPPARPPAPNGKHTPS